MPKPPLVIQPTTLWDYPSQNYGRDGAQGDQNYAGATPSYIIAGFESGSPVIRIRIVIARLRMLQSDQGSSSLCFQTAGDGRRKFTVATDRLR